MIGLARARFFLDEYNEGGKGVWGVDCGIECCTRREVTIGEW